MQPFLFVRLIRKWDGIVFFSAHQCYIKSCPLQGGADANHALVVREVGGNGKVYRTQFGFFVGLIILRRRRRKFSQLFPLFSFPQRRLQTRDSGF